jgi:hypothetical protein
MNPHKVIKDHWEKKTSGLEPAAFNALMERGIEIGADDLVDVDGDKS